MIKSKKNRAIILTVIIIFILFIFSIIFSLFTITSESIINGIYIENINVSYLNKEQAKNLILKNCEEKKSSNLTINFISENVDDVKYSFFNSLLPLDIEYDVSQAIDDAYSIGRNKNIFQNNFDILKTMIFKNNIKLNYSLNGNILNQTIDKIASELPEKLINSSYYIEEDNLVILKGSDGYIIKKEDLIKDIESTINNISEKENVINSYIFKEKPEEINIEKIHNEIYTVAQNAYYEQNPFKVYQEIEGIDFDKEKAKKILEESKDEYTIPLVITVPEVTINNLEIDIFPDLLGTFSTKYDLQNENRANNLTLATSKINEKIIAPGKEFSYNSIVGARTIAAGYKDAKIYSNGQVVDGIGGGICQVSSTLYNAAMFANLEIKERHNHQFVTSYVTPGRDATVAYGSKDLKFVNNRSYPIKIIATANDGILKISIYGIKENIEYDVSFDNEIINPIPYTTKYEYNSELSSSEQKVKQLGANGAVVNNYKVVKLNGSIVSRTLISQDTYNALNKVIETGNVNEIEHNDE